jgi:hypothetical protein
MSSHFSATALVALVGLAGPIGAQADSRSGCYRADRPLGSSASPNGIPGPIGERLGETGEGLRVLATFRLLDGGHVDRPGTVMRESWAAGSRWAATGDTLLVELTTLAVGWQLRLIRSQVHGDSGYVGEAQYVSDVSVANADSARRSLLRVPLRVTRELCLPPTDGVRPTHSP